MEFISEFSKQKILLIENDPEQAFLYRESFRQEKLSLTVVVDWGVVSGLIKSYCPDLIIVNLVADNEKIAEKVLEEVRTIPSAQDIPIIIFTDLNKDLVEEKFQTLGASQIWSKSELCTPCSSLLAQKIKAHLGLPTF
jgi:CheY-like chemotaxis protein